jgi:hypothetical protein
MPAVQPKAGSRFHFELPGSVQGFTEDSSVESKGLVTLENVEGHSQLGQRSLAIHYHHLASGRIARVSTPTFIPPEAINMIGYELHASPTLYPGQTVRAGFMADPRNGGLVVCRLYIQTYGAEDKLVMSYGPQTHLQPGEVAQTEWRLEDTGGEPIAKVGLEITTDDKRADGTVYLDFLTWSGEPTVVFKRPASRGTMWRRSWVKGVEPADPYASEAFRLVQNAGTGLLMQGTRAWMNYSVTATITPHMVQAAGIGARVQGMNRYYALLLCNGGKARLIKALDGEKILAEVKFAWQPETGYLLQLDVKGTQISCRIDEQTLFELDDFEQPLIGGGIALVCREGRMATETVSVSPL